MQHLILYFEHDINDIIPWSECIERLRPLLSRSGTGEFVGDDMAIDGGDCEAVFRGSEANALFAILVPHFRDLAFLRKPTTHIELVYGELGGSSVKQTVRLDS